MKLSINKKEEDKLIGKLSTQIYPAFDIKTDNEIWNELKRGNEDAFNHIYRKNIASLFNFGSQITSNKETVKDAIQNIFIDIRKGKESLKNMYSIRGYLFKALKREIIRRLEKEKRHTELNDKMASFMVDFSCEQKIIQGEMVKEKKMKFEKILNELSLKHRQGILLYYREGFSYDEIADILGLKNSKSARKLLYRALDSARELIKK